MPALGVNALAMFTRGGLHELQPAPDNLLLELNPQFLVTVGTYEHADAINRHRARVEHLRNLLPNTVIGVRWWPDDNILNTVTPAGYAQLFFKLHVPGTVLFVGNEDANVHTDPAVFADTVRKHTEVVRLAAAAGIPVGVCCTSTGNPALAQYDLLAPLFQAMHEARQSGVVSWWRLNRYFTATDNGHIREHEQVLPRLRKLSGVPIPPLVFGEIGALRSYFEPEAGYHVMSDFGEGIYIQRLVDLGLEWPHILYCYGKGVYDTRWKDCAVTDAFVSAYAKRQQRTVKTAYQEWQERELPMTQPPTDQRTAITTMTVNLRPAPTTAQPRILAISEGAEVTVWMQPVSVADGFSWVHAQWGEQRGYIAASVGGAATFEVAQPPPPDVDEPALCSPFLTDEEHQQMITAITRMETASGELRAAFGELRQLWTLALERKQAA